MDSMTDTDAKLTETENIQVQTVTGILTVAAWKMGCAGEMCHVNLTAECTGMTTSR